MTANQMKQQIEANLEGATAIVETDGEHFEAIVVSAAFEGISRVKQHKMVYATLREELKGEVHALALRTLTPEAWAREQNG